MSIIEDDLIERSANIHWPDGFDPDHADLFAHNAIIINASVESVWAKLITATAWPTWYSNASDVVVNDSSGQLGQDVTFNWTTFGLEDRQQDLRVRPALPSRLVRQRRSVARLPHLAAHPPVDHSAYVVMEEIGMGDGANHLALTNPGHMHRGHDLWNISLKFTCEA